MPGTRYIITRIEPSSSEGMNSAPRNGMAISDTVKMPKADSTRPGWMAQRPMQERTIPLIDLPHKPGLLFRHVFT